MDKADIAVVNAMLGTLLTQGLVELLVRERVISAEAAVALARNTENQLRATKTPHGDAAADAAKTFGDNMAKLLTN